MAHIPATDLHQILNDAKQQVTIGGTYYHYKKPDKYYTLVDVVIIEANDTVGVLYKAEYDDLKGITFMRPLDDFLAEVDTDNGRIPRFTKVS